MSNDTQARMLKKAEEVLDSCHKKGWLLNNEPVVRVYEANNRPQVLKKKGYARTAGVYITSLNTIYLNLSLAQYDESCLQHMLEDTIPHEIAHAVVRFHYNYAKQAHGPEFRRVCRTLGGSGSTYYSAPKAVEFAIKNRQTRTKSRYVYRSEFGVEVLLTKQKHEKMQTLRTASMWIKDRARESTIYAHSFTGEVKKTA